MLGDSKKENKMNFSGQNWMPSLKFKPSNHSSLRFMIWKVKQRDKKRHHWCIGIYPLKNARCTWPVLHSMKIVKSVKIFRLNKILILCHRFSTFSTYTYETKPILNSWHQPQILNPWIPIFFSWKLLSVCFAQNKFSFEN